MLYNNVYKTFWLLVLIFSLLGACSKSSDPEPGSDPGPSSDPTAENKVPLADAGADQFVLLNSTVTLDASLSTDEDNDTLVYTWKIIGQPPEGTAKINQTDSSTSSFTPILHGEYLIELVVNDGTVDSEPSQILITTIAPTKVTIDIPDNHAASDITLFSSFDDSSDAIENNEASVLVSPTPQLVAAFGKDDQVLYQTVLGATDDTETPQLNGSSTALSLIQLYPLIASVIANPDNDIADFMTQLAILPEVITLGEKITDLVENTETGWDSFEDPELVTLVGLAIDASLLYISETDLKILPDREAVLSKVSNRQNKVTARLFSRGDLEEKSGVSVFFLSESDGTAKLRIINSFSRYVAFDMKGLYPSVPILAPSGKLDVSVTGNELKDQPRTIRAYGPGLKIDNLSSEDYLTSEFYLASAYTFIFELADNMVSIVTGTSSVSNKETVSSGDFDLSKEVGSCKKGISKSFLKKVAKKVAVSDLFRDEIISGEILSASLTAGSILADSIVKQIELADGSGLKLILCAVSNDILNNKEARKKIIAMLGNTASMLKIVNLAISAKKLESNIRAIINSKPVETWPLSNILDVNITPDSAQGFSPLDVTFDVTCNGETQFCVNSMSIDFDDGSSPAIYDKIEINTHTFTLPEDEDNKTYNVIVEVKDFDNAVFKKIIPVTVKRVGTESSFKVLNGDVEIVEGFGAHDFGDVELGGSSEPVIFTIFNSGNETLKLISVLPDDSLALGVVSVTGPETLEVLAGESTTFSVRFIPDDAGFQTSNITVSAEFIDNFSFSVGGTGFELDPDPDPDPDPTQLIGIDCDIVANEITELSSFDNSPYISKKLVDGSCLRLKEGNQIDYYANSEIINSSVPWIIKPKENGSFYSVIEGDVIVYYENASIFDIKPYIDGQIHGTSKRYFESGLLRSETAYSRGVKHGIDKLYYDSNYKIKVLKSETPYVDGQIHGLQKTYFHRGTVSNGDETYSYKFEVLDSETPFVNGEKHGFATTYYNTEGVLSSETPYIDGLKHGAYKFYYFNGNLGQDIPYENGLIQGNKLVYYENGDLSSKTPFVDGLVHGTYIVYNKGGTVRYTETYQNGVLIP